MNNKLEEYLSLCNKSLEVLELYNKLVNENLKELNIKFYDYELPHIANFSDNDNVVNLMGINPSIDEARKQQSGNIKLLKGRDDILKEMQKQNLDLYHIPFECNLKNENNIGICENRNLPKKAYKALFDGRMKMSWQKYDEQFLTEFYGKNGKKYSDLLNELRNSEEYKNYNFNNQYLIFTNLVYMSDNEQRNVLRIIGRKRGNDELRKILNDIRTKIKECFELQLKFYKAKLTIVANKSASDYVSNYILKDDPKWEMVDELLYKKDKQYVYLTGRFFDSFQSKSEMKAKFEEDVPKLKEIIDLK